MVERVQPSERVARRKLAPLFAACLFVALAGAQVKAPKPPRESAPEKSAQSHGTLPWFAGSYEELGRQSKEQQLQVVIFLWVDASRWCRRLETEALSDPKLAQALDGMLLWNGDAQRDAGKMWAERLGVSSFPVMIFCDSQGHPIERLDGYQPKEQFLTEVARVLRNEGTAPDLRRKLDQGPDDIELRARVEAISNRFYDQSFSHRLRICLGSEYLDWRADDPIAAGHSAATELSATVPSSLRTKR